MDIFDRIASQFQKEARIPSVGNPKYEPCPCKNPKAKGPCKCPTGETWTEKEVKAYYDDFKGSLGKEWAKYEGAFDPSTGKMNQDRIRKNMGGGKGKKHDLSALGQLGKKASFYDDEIIDDLGLDRVAAQWGKTDPSFGYQAPEERSIRDRRLNPTYKEVKSKNERKRIRERNTLYSNLYYAHPMESASSEEVKEVRLYTGVRDVTKIPAPRDEFPKPSQISLGVEVAPDLFLFHRSQKPIQNISPTRDPEDYVLLKSNVPYLGGLSRKASFYDEEIIDDLGFDREASFLEDEIIDDLGLDREASYGYQTPAMRRKPSKQNIAHRLLHLNRQKAKRMLTREEEMELRDLEERHSKSNLSAYARAFENRRASFLEDEIIDDLGLERTASDREAELLAEDLMVLADEIMSGKRRGPLKSSVRRAIGKAIRNSLKGSGLKNRTKKMRKTLNRARTQESKARARVRKQRRYNRYSR